MIKLAIFDMDGTVFESYLDWAKIKEELGLERTGNILKELYRDDNVDHRRLRLLESYEEENTRNTRPIKGITRWLEILKEREITTALVTNNNKPNTDFLLEKFDLSFGTVVTREMRLWKPEPDAFHYLMDKYGRRPAEIISIGDSTYDVRASRAAGISRIYIIRKAGAPLPIEGDDITYFDDFIHLEQLFLSAPGEAN